jgi:hypothetical protein
MASVCTVIVLLAAFSFFVGFASPSPLKLQIAAVNRRPGLLPRSPLHSE